MSFPDRSSFPDGFEVEMVDGGDGENVLVVRGEIDLVSAPTFSSALHAALTTSPRVVLHMSDVTFMDSSGISALLQSTRDRTDAHVVVREPSRAVRTILTITGLQSILEQSDSATSMPGN